MRCGNVDLFRLDYWPFRQRLHSRWRRVFPWNLIVLPGVINISRYLRHLSTRNEYSFTIPWNGGTRWDLSLKIPLLSRCVTAPPESSMCCSIYFVIATVATTIATNHFHYANFSTLRPATQHQYLILCSQIAGQIDLSAMRLGHPR